MRISQCVLICKLNKKCVFSYEWDQPMVEVHQSEEPGSELRVSCRIQPILGLPTLILTASADLRACVPAVVPPRSSVSQGGASGGSGLRG